MAWRFLLASSIINNHGVNLAFTNDDQRGSAHGAGELLHPTKRKVLDEFRASSEVERYKRLKTERDGYRKAIAVGQARLEELAATRRRLEAEAKPGLADALLQIDQERATAQAKVDEAAKQEGAIAQTESDAYRGLDPLLRALMTPAGREAHVALVEQRDALLAKITGRIAEDLAQLGKLQAALAWTSTNAAFTNLGEALSDGPAGVSLPFPPGGAALTVTQAVLGRTT